MLPLKAVMAVLLVADHLTFHVDAGWLRPFREIGAPIVSIFFFISGFGLMRSYSTRGASYLDGFFRKRIWKVLLPALVALALFYIFDWNWSRDFIGEFRDLFTKGQPILPYSWFVVAIILFYVSFWLIFRYLPEKLHLAGLVSAGIILGGAAIALGYDRCWWVCNLAFPAGAFYAKYEPGISQKWLSDGTKALIAIGAMVAGFLVFYLPGNQYLFPVCYVFIPLAVAMTVSVLPLEKIDWKPVAFIGGIAYEIYLCQGIAMEFLHSGTVCLASVPVYITGVYILTIALAWSVKAICTLLTERGKQ